MHDDAELNIEAASEKIADFEAKKYLYIFPILEGEVKKFNDPISDVLVKLCKEYKQALSLANERFKAMKQAIAESAQKLIYAKVRCEILMPIASKPIGMMAEGVTNKLQETLARHSKGGALTDMLVDAAERAKVAEKMGVSSGSDDVVGIGASLTPEEQKLINDLQELKLSQEDAGKIDEAAKELASRFESLSAEHDDQESFLQSAAAVASEYGPGVVSAALMVAQIYPPTAASTKLVGFLSKADNAATILGYLEHLKALPLKESIARAQVAELDWDPTNEQERDLSLNPMLPGGPKAKFGEVDQEALTLDVLSASSMLIKGAIGKKLQLAKMVAKGSERSKVPHGEETLDNKLENDIVGGKKVKPEAEVELPVAAESSSNLKDVAKPTAKEVVQENPFVARKYLQEIEELTGRDLPEVQVKRLKEELQTREFRKLDVDAAENHRKIFDNQKFKDELRKEWERETKQTWPKYEEDVFNSQGKRIKEKDQLYDAHHIIQNNHGGPHEWWNIHPASKKEHEVIHGTGSAAREIFNANKK